MILNFLFPRKYGERTYSIVTLILRVAFGLMLIGHGFQKIEGFSAMSSGFPDPLGIGSCASLVLAIFGEFACSIALILGVLSRLAVIPMIITMAVAFFGVHGGNIADGELALAYLVVFVALLISGPGQYSIDGAIARRLRR